MTCSKMTSYDETIRNFRLEIPEFYNFGFDVIEKRALENDKTAYIAVAESAVVGKPDEMRTEIVKAYVVLAKDYEGSEELKKEIQAFVKKNTASYKYPREIEFRDTLPKTIPGKIRRVELRAED